MTNYRCLIKNRIDESIKALLTEQAQSVLEPEVIHFLDSIKGYTYTDIDNTTNLQYVCWLYQKDKSFDRKKSSKIVFQLTGNEVKPVSKIVLSYPIDQQVITAVDNAMDKMYPTAKRKSIKLDSYIEYSI